MKCILALDQGTTSSRAILFDHEGRIRSVAQKEFKQHYPRPGWVEHDPEEIWDTQQEMVHQAMRHAGAHCEDIASIGITNQRESVVLWNRETGKAIYPVIVWQDRRTSEICERLRSEGTESIFRSKTGLPIDPYFSGTKLKWMLDHIDGARLLAEQNKLAFGTIDSWLLWKLTRGARHATDASNASRTLLFNIHTMDWDRELLDLLDIPENILPEVLPSSSEYGVTDRFLCTPGCSINGIAGDQQAALFGQACFKPGEAKNTYGTGSFLLLNTGNRPTASENKLLSTVGWSRNNETTYALEGSVFTCGAVVQWLRDELGLIDQSSDIEALAAQVEDSAGVHFVPAFTGLGAPYWNPEARGSITGLTRGSGKSHIARAALESMCFQTIDVLLAMEQDAGQHIEVLRVDGGAAKNNLLLQIQADLLQRPVLRPKQTETTAFGAAALAGLGAGFWSSMEEVSELIETDRIFEPQISADEAAGRLDRWREAVCSVNREPDS